MWPEVTPIFGYRLRRRELESGKFVEGKDIVSMSPEKNSEKLAVYVALVASIVALVMTMLTYLATSSGPKPVGAGSVPGRSGGTMPDRRPPGGGEARMMRGPAQSPEYLQKYEEQLGILRRLYEETEAKYKNGGTTIVDVWNSLHRWDEGRLNLLRLKNGRRPVPSFADAYLGVLHAGELLAMAEEQHRSGSVTQLTVAEARLKLNAAELRLLEAERRLDPAKVSEAKAVVKEYPAKLTDEQLEKLLAAEQRSFGPR